MMTDLYDTQVLRTPTRPFSGRITRPLLLGVRVAAEDSPRGRFGNRADKSTLP
jgi:hypothetical protein